MRRLVLVACLATVVPALAFAQAPAPSAATAPIELADFVQDDLSIFIDVPDADRIAKLVAASPWGRLFGDPKVEAFLRPLVDDTIESQGDIAKVIGVGLAELGEMFAGRSQFALREVAFRGKTRLQFAWLHFLGERTSDIDKLVAMYGEEDGGLEEVQIGDHVGYRIPVDDELSSAIGPTILIITFRGHLLLTSSLKWATPIVESKPRDAKSFRKSPSFARLNGSGAIRMFVDPTRSLAIEKARYGEETAATRLVALTAVAGAASALPMTARVDLEGGEFIERYRGYTNERTPERVRQALLALRRGFTLLRHVPAEAGVVFATRMPLADGFRAFAAYVETGTHLDDFEEWFGDEADAADTVERVVEICREAKLGATLLDTLGDEIVLTLTPPRSGFVPTPLLRVTVADRAKLIAFLDGPAAETLGEHGTVKKTGDGLWGVRVSGLPTAVVLGLGDGHLVAGITAGAVREGLRTPKASIVDHATFKAAMKTVGASDLATASTIGYVDTPRWAGFGYEALIPLVDTFANDVNLDPGAAPGRERVASHFTPSALSVRYTQDGYEADVRGVMAPMSLGATIFAAPFLIADWLGRRAKTK